MKRSIILAAALTLLSAAGTGFAVSSESEITYRLLDAENNRRVSDPVFAEAATSADPVVRTAAARAIGRIGDAGFLPQLITLIADQAPAVRTMAFFALGQTPSPAVLPVVAQALATETSPQAKAAGLLALGRLGGEAELALTEAALAELPAAAAQATGFLLNKDSATWAVNDTLLSALAAAAAGREPAASAAAFALSRYKGTWSDTAAAAVTASLRQAKSPPAQGLLARAVAKLKTDSARAALLGTLLPRTPLPAKVEILRALGNFADQDPVQSVLRRHTRGQNDQVRVQALQSLARVTAASDDLVAQVTRLTAASQPYWLRQTALETLTALAPEKARALALSELNKTRSQLHRAALAVLGAVKHADDLPRLAAFAGHTDVKVAGAALEALSAYEVSALPADAESTLRAAIGRHDLVLTYIAADIAKKAGLKVLAADFAAAYAGFHRDDDFDARVAILGALELLGSPADLPLLEKALRDPVKPVAEAAAKAYMAITGVDVSDRIPARSIVSAKTPAPAALHRAVRALVDLHTTKGVITLRMSPAAPLTAHNFVTLADRGFYNGLTFHRVLPNFVAQGGDPRGDGWGGPGYMIRDEFSLQSHRRGSVGMASSGKDTAGCQFFINHSPNLHLDGNYTIFAHVVSGMDVADRLGISDKILRAVVR
jgi:cyclophilin family peptidyl-prolyl cis-trans isomerase